jgi:CheY-like chemotaxis protein/predicted XRE-type DNA-binding protein
MATIDLKALLGMAIKTERCVQGISQEELAERAGLHRTYVSDVERGARNPSIASIEKLAEALKLSVSALFNRAGNGGRSTEFVEILMVEDDPRDVELTKLAFEKARITNPLHVVRDGVEALDFLFGTGAYQHRAYAALPQIILLDLNLPRKSGLEVLRRIKADKLTTDISVIVLTVSTRDRDMAECRRLGVESYIIKPVGFQKFSEVTPDLNMAWTLVKPPRTEMAKSARIAGRKTWRPKSK